MTEWGIAQLPTGWMRSWRARRNVRSNVTSHTHSPSGQAGPHGTTIPAKGGGREGEEGGQGGGGKARYIVCTVRSTCMQRSIGQAANKEAIDSRDSLTATHRGSYRRSGCGSGCVVWIRLALFDNGLEPRDCFCGGAEGSWAERGDGWVGSELAWAERIPGSG